MKRLVYLVAAGLLIATVGATPASAQGRDNSADNSCTQATSGAGGNITPAPQVNRGNGSNAVLLGVVAALINANALNNLDVAANALNSSPVQVVCLNDALNQNDLTFLNDVLSHNTVLNGSLNNLAQNALQNADIALLNNARVVTVDVASASPSIFVMH
jgi:hypothetical protein